MALEWVDEIERRAQAATPGPWFVQNPDDIYRMNVIAVTTGPVDDIFDLHEWEYADRVVALTLLQTPRYACLEDKYRNHPWMHNAEFIAHARDDVPKLCQAVRELAAALSNVLRHITLDDFGLNCEIDTCCAGKEILKAKKILERVKRGED